MYSNCNNFVLILSSDFLAIFTGLSKNNIFAICFLRTPIATV